MSASTSFPPKMPHTGVTFDGTTPIVSNKKHLNSEHMKRSGTTITSNRTASTASTTSSLSSISSATASQFSTASPSIQFSPESSFHPGSAQRSMQTSFFPKTHKMVLRSPQSVIYTNDRLPHRTRKTKSSHNKYKKNPFKSSPLDFLSDFIVKACRMDRCAGEELDGIYEEESILSDDDSDSYLDIYEASVESESYIDDSLGTQSIASSQTPFRQSNVMQARRASLSSTSRNKSFTDSADDNSLIDSTAMPEKSLMCGEPEAATCDSLRKDITKPTPLMQSASARYESRGNMADIVDRYYKKLSTVGIQSFLNEHDSAHALPRKIPGLLFLRLADDPHLMWEDSETKKSSIFSIFDITSIRKLNPVHAMSSSRFCISLRDDALIFLEAVDETQMTRVVKVLKVIVARYTRKMIQCDHERLGQMLTNNNETVTGAYMSSLTDNLVANCVAKK